MATIPSLPMTGAQLRTALTDINAEVGGKAASTHNHTIAQVTGLQTALDAKAATATAVTSADVRTIVRMTQAAYDALAAKDPQTLYVVI